MKLSQKLGDLAHLNEKSLARAGHAYMTLNRIRPAVLRSNQGQGFMTVIELPDEQAEALRAKASAAGLTLEAWLEQLAGAEEKPPEQPFQTAPRRRIWDVIAENMQRVPQEDLAQMPKDALSQIDHYVYGVPRRDE